jgi:hypothetical protein
MPKKRTQNYGDALVNVNGQVTIPAEARREMGFEPATRVIFARCLDCLLNSLAQT